MSCNVSPMRAGKVYGLRLLVLSLRKSDTKRTLPSFFGTIRVGDPHSELRTNSSTPSFTSWSSSFLNICLHKWGIEKIRVANCPMLIFRVLRMQDLSGMFLRKSLLLMSASKISWHSKQSLVTALCLKQSQETISTILSGVGAVIWGGHIKLSKREKRRDVNYPKQTASALRKLVSSGV